MPVQTERSMLPLLPAQTERSMLPLLPVQTVGWTPPPSYLPCWQRLSRRSLR